MKQVPGLMSHFKRVLEMYVRAQATRDLIDMRAGAHALMRNARLRCVWTASTAPPTRVRLQVADREARSIILCHFFVRQRADILLGLKGREGVQCYSNELPE